MTLVRIIIIQQMKYVGNDHHDNYDDVDDADDADDADDVDGAATVNAAGKQKNTLHIRLPR